MRRGPEFSALLGLILLASVIPASAAIVQVVAGSDYLATLPGTTFGGAVFNGVAVGPGNADTIVRRPNADVTNGSASVPIEMVALQLVSALPVDFGLGLDNYYITLQSVRGGPATIGRMTINSGGFDDHLPNTPEGTFSSFFDVFFDVRKGNLNGPIALSDSLTLTNQGAFWDADPDQYQVIVPGLVGDVFANRHTNLLRNSNSYQMDFFPIGPFQEAHPTGAVHVVTGATTTPEPGSWLLVVGGALMLLGRRRGR